MMLFASILSLQRNDIQALRITDPYSVHRVVYGLFEDLRSPDEKQSHVQNGILYADEGNHAQGRNILILSNREPALTALTKDGRAVGIVRTKPISSEYLNHQKYEFKVIVNPTRRNNQSKKLIPIRSYEEVEQWFSSRSLKDWGFKTTQMEVERIDVLRFSNKHQQLITLAHAHVRGQLIVTDSTKFQQSFATGLGRGNAFGCGLLHLVPITPNPFDFN